VERIAKQHAGQRIRARSLRVAVVVFVVITVIFLTVVFLFVWLFSNENIDSYQTIRGVSVGAFWKYSAHAQWYAAYLFSMGSEVL
jgi:hypothetical protein